MMRWVIGLLCLFLYAQQAHAQEKIVFGLSQNQVSITPNFAGTEIIVYGAIDRTGVDILARQKKLDLIVTISSTPTGVTVRKKTEVLSVWTNTQSIDRVFAPAYYTIASSSPVEDILSDEQRKEHTIGIDDIIYVPYHAAYKSLDINSFKQAVIRLRKKAGLYRESNAGVIITDNTLFQTRLQLPENIVSGDYRVRIFLVKNNAVQDMLVSDIYVRKAGLERILYELAHDKPLQYGILCIVLAIVFGWLAFQLFSTRRS